MADSGSCGGSSATPVSSPSAATAATTATPVVFPPTTVAQAKRLAAVEGNSTDVREFHSESVGIAACPQPKRSVTVKAGLSGRQVAADLLKYFYDQQLDNSCGSLVLGYNDPSEYGSVYTVGRVNLDMNGSTHRLEVDAVADQVMFVISY